MSDTTLPEKRAELETLEEQWGHVPVGLRMANIGITFIMIGVWSIWGLPTAVWWAWGGWLILRYGFEMLHPKVYRLYELRREVADELAADEEDPQLESGSADS